MALTKVGPAGIGSTPGTGYVIGDSFLHSTGLNATNAYYTGIVTAQTFRVLGNFQVDGTTTTLDTEVTSVDKLEVAANNTTVGVAITQSGSGDILNLYDGASEVFSVADGGTVTTSGDISVGGDLTLPDAIVHSGDPNTKIRFPTNDTVTIETGGTERLRITSGGDAKIGSGNPSFSAGGGLHVESGTQANIRVTETGNTGVEIQQRSGGSGILNVIDNANLLLQTNNIERLRITSGGSVGIGTNNPETDFHLHSSSNGSNSEILLTNGDTGSSATDGFKIALNTGAGGEIWNYENDYIRFGTNNAERLRILSGGQVIIGDSASDLSGDHTFMACGSKHAFQFDGNTGTYLSFTLGSANGNVDIEADARSGGYPDLTFTTYNDERLRITSAGLVGIGTVAPFNNSSDIDIRGGSSALSDGGQIVTIGVNTKADNTSQLAFGVSDADGYAWIRSYASGVGGKDLVFASVAENLRITSAGDVKIGTTNNVTFGSRRALTVANGTTGAVLSLYNSTTATSNPRISSNPGGSEINDIGIHAASTNGNIIAYTNNDTERLRITSAGNVTIGGKSNPNWSSTVDALTIGYAGVLYEDSYTSGTDNYIILGNNTFYNASSGGNTYIRNDQAQRIMMQGGAWWFQSAGTGTAGNAITYTDRLRITNDGKVGINMSTPTFELDVNGRFRATHGSSGLFFEEINNGAALWLDGANGDFSGGDYYGIIADNSGRLQFGYAGNAHMQLNSTGQLYLNGYPHDHTVAGGSHLKLRAGAGAWGISLGMRASQNDYAYFGFTDMNGDEQIGDIFMQRTGTSTGHMVFSTNNGSAGSSNRLRIDSNGRTCISPTSHFGSASTNMALSIVNNGGTGGYPAIHLGSVATGGNTNSVQGMSIVATDANWNLQTSSGGVHGLGILTGNSSNSGNVAMYIRSDKKTITGPSCYDELDTAISSGTAFCVAGGGLSIGSLGNGGDTVQGGRNVIGWYMYRYNGTGGYAHLTTSLWGGASSNSMYMMGGFRIHGYRYSSAGVSEENIYFHNWSGSLANYSRYHWGNWDPGNTAYVNSSGYVTLRLSNGSYYGYDIDLIQHAWYPIRDIKVTNVTYNGNATI